MEHRTHPHDVVVVQRQRFPTTHLADHLAIEEALELRLAGRTLTTTMRTPGDDIDLAHGWMLTEGIITSAADVASLRFDLGADGDDQLNVLAMALAAQVAPPAVARERLATTTASCGICGTSALDAITVDTSFPPANDPTVVSVEVVTSLPDALRASQPLFAQTGGTHGAALATAEGSLLAVREDVGRHNAVDKVLGWALQDGGMPLAGRLLVLSGRAGFELVQKAAMAGVPIVVAVGAPTALAVTLAEAAGITLIGFVRAGRANVYTRPDRLIAIG